MSCLLLSYLGSSCLDSSFLLFARLLFFSSLFLLCSFCFSLFSSLLFSSLLCCLVLSCVVLCCHVLSCLVLFSSCLLFSCLISSPLLFPSLLLFVSLLLLSRGLLAFFVVSCLLFIWQIFRCVASYLTTYGALRRLSCCIRIQVLNSPTTRPSAPSSPFNPNLQGASGAVSIFHTLGCRTRQHKTSTGEQQGKSRENITQDNTKRDKTRQGQKDSFNVPRDCDPPVSLRNCCR